MKFYSFFGMLLSLFLFLNSVEAADLREEMHIKHLRDGEKFSLGVAVRNMNEELKQESGLSGGAVIVDVLENSEAEKIGLQEDDIIVRFDGKEISDASGLNQMIADLENEKRVTLEVYRDGSVNKFEANLVPREQKEVKVFFDGEDMDIDLPDLKELSNLKMERFHPFHRKGGYLGIRTENLTDQLKDYFQVEHGILVEEVVKDSPAEKAGMQAGDIIISIEDRPIEDYSDLIRTVNYYNPGEEIKIHYDRKGKKNTVKVKLEEAEAFSSSPDWFDGEHLINIPDIRIEEEKLKEAEEKLKNIKIDIELYII